jgi:hypothetical protein
LKHPECTVPRHISRTLQFDLNAHKTDSTPYLSHINVFVLQHSKDLATVYAVCNMKFSLVTCLKKDPNV